jgi:hypothetical protein
VYLNEVFSFFLTTPNDTETQHGESLENVGGGV